MKSGKKLVALAVALLIAALSSVAVGQEKATAEEVVAKVKEAASILSKTGDLAQFNQKQGPWVLRHLYRGPRLRQEGHSGSPHHAGASRTRRHDAEGHQG